MCVFVCVCVCVSVCLYIHISSDGSRRSRRRKSRISPPQSLEFGNSFLLQDILVPQVRYFSTKLHMQEILLQLQPPTIYAELIQEIENVCIKFKPPPSDFVCTY